MSFAARVRWDGFFDVVVDRPGHCERLGIDEDGVGLGELNASIGYLALDATPLTDEVRAVGLELLPGCHGGFELRSE